MVPSLQSNVKSNVEILDMMLRPFYLPREFGCILLFVAYSPKSGKVTQAAHTISDCVHDIQLQYPGAPAIVLGDLNQCNLETVLPDKCFVYIKEAYVSKCEPPVINLDHNVVHMITVYKTKLKRNKLVKRLSGNYQMEVGNS